MLLEYASHRQLFHEGLDMTGGLHLVGVHALRRSSKWFLLLGALSMIAGILAIGYSLVTTIASVVFFGSLLLIVGGVGVAHAFYCKEWGGFFIDLFSGLLYSVVGLMMILHPVEGAIGLTLLIAASLLISGVFKMAVAASTQSHNWVWLFFSGALNLLLGIMIWSQWPVSGLWVIGLFVGLDMLSNGWWLLMLGLTARTLPEAG